MGKPAQPPAAPTLSWLQTVPGIGKRLRLVLFSAMHALARCPRAQDGVSSGRVVHGAKAAAGKRSGPSGTKLGNAERTGALSAAARLCLRNHPAGPKSLARFEKKHGKGTALTSWAPPLARAVYAMVKRRGVCALDTWRQRDGRRAGAPAASLGHDGRSLAPVLCHEAPRASTHAHAHRGPLPCPGALDGTPALAPGPRATVPAGDRVLPRPRTCASLAHRCATPHVSRTVGGSRSVSRAQSTSALLSGTAIPMALDPHAVFGAATLVHQPTDMQTEHGARGGRRWAESAAENLGTIRSAGESVS